MDLDLSILGRVKLSNSKSRVCDAVFDAHDWLKKNHT